MASLIGLCTLCCTGGWAGCWAGYWCGRQIGEELGEERNKEFKKIKREGDSFNSCAALGGVAVCMMHYVCWERRD